MDKQQIQKNTIIKSMDGSRTIKFIATDESVIDYDRDVVKILGIDTTKILQNKSILFNHKQSELPVAKLSTLDIQGTKLIGSAEFPEKGIYGFADVVYDLVDKGFINQMSISFLPDYDSIEYKKVDGKEIRIINKSTLLEISFVNIACNSGANVLRKSLETEWESGKIDGEQLKELQSMIVDTTTTVDKQVEDLKKELQDKITYIEFIEKELVEMNEKIVKLEEEAVKNDIEVEEDVYAKILKDLSGADTTSITATNDEDAVYEKILKQLKEEK